MSSDLVFKKDNKVLKEFSLNTIKMGKIGKVNSTELDLYNIARGYQKKYLGYNLFDLLGHIYGPKWKESKRITFAAQGIHPSHWN
jgi:hypothetical protein